MKNPLKLLMWVLLIVFCALGVIIVGSINRNRPVFSPAGFAFQGRNAHGSWEYRNMKDGAVYILIPSGEFLMGSAENEGNDDEHPARRVYLDAYLIAKYEVTNVLFRRFILDTGCRAEGEWEKHATSKRDLHPVANVTWKDAAAYCAWAGGRLPTEAEWEKAARGTGGYDYPWGGPWDPSRIRCSVGGLGVAGGSAPVGSHPQGVSQWGCQDIAGNVWEWCSDEYSESYYRDAPLRNPKGPEHRECRVLRGGGWANISPDVFRCAYRSGFPPRFRFPDRGFRPAADVRKK
jgi:formylglycine-generating enzyme required for sulfatase activity